MIQFDFNEKVRESVNRLREENETGYLVLDDILYLLDISNAELGSVRFIPFNRASQTALGWSEQYTYGMQTTWAVAILGPGPRTRQELNREVPYPEDVPSVSEPGRVIPNYR